MLQIVTLELDITAADYMAWVHTPETAIEMPGLRSARVGAPCNDSVTAVLEWDDGVELPRPARAAELAGLPVTADVRGITWTTCGEAAACPEAAEARLAVAA